MPAPEAKYNSTGTFDFSWDDFEVMSDIVAAEEILEHTSKGGIVIPDVKDAQHVRWARVIACGPGRIHENGHFAKMEYAPGDVVLFGKYQSGGEALIIGGKKALMFRQGDFVGRIRRGRESLKVVA